MEKNTPKLTGRRESRLWRRFASIVLVVVARPDLYEEIAKWTREFLSLHAPNVLENERDGQEERQGQERDMAEERRLAVELFYRGLGMEVIVPKPVVASNREYRRRQKNGQELFFRLASSVLTYMRFMQLVGQADHWTLTHEDRYRIKWEEAQTGYWFWADTAPKCPRLKTAWNVLNANPKRLISLEEYVIAWWMCRKKGETLDISTWSWTRTRYNIAKADEPERLGALHVDGYDGKVFVGRNAPEYLVVSRDFGGGRSVEVVQDAA